MEKISVIYQKLLNLSLELGFDDMAIVNSEKLDKDGDVLDEWIKEGKHAGMDYMSRNTEMRKDPRLLFDNVKSIIVLLHNYAPPALTITADQYRIASYAFGKDYHKVIKKKLLKIIEFLKTLHPDITARGFVDSAPVMERALAKKAGLGWIGKNTHLISKKKGSYFFISSIFSNLEMEYDVKLVSDACGTCTRCIDACPTKALSPYSLDARKCISYHTIENKSSVLPENLKGKFNNWIFGCDICQEVCPWNRFSRPNEEPSFQPNPMLFQLKKNDWQNLSEEEFNKFFEGSPIKRTKFNGLKRNINFVKDD